MPSFWDKVSYEYSVKSYSTRWNKLQPPVLHTLEAPASEHLQLPLNADHSLKIELLVWTGTHTPSVICGAGFHFFHFLRSVLWLFVWPDPKWVIVITGMGFTTRQISLIQIRCTCLIQLRSVGHSYWRFFPFYHVFCFVVLYTVFVCWRKGYDVSIWDNGLWFLVRVALY